MSNYTKSTNFATKDALPSGDPLKIVKGTEIDTEFNNIATAIATKSDSASPTFTGTVTAPDFVGDLTGDVTGNLTGNVTGNVTGNLTGNVTGNLTGTASNVADGAVTAAKLASGVAVANLGYTPVQQGTGTGQLGNSVKIGWSGTQLKAQVDATDMGPFVMQSSFDGSNQSLSGNGYQKLPGGLIVQWGSFSQTGTSTTVTLPIAFPNAMLNVQQTIIGSGSVSAPGVSIANTQQFDSVRDPAVSNVSCYFFAIGY